MNVEPIRSDPRVEPAAPAQRVFVYELGWKIELKANSDREFCYMTAPGQDYYHRLLNRELYLTNGEERLCLACARRRGLLSHEPRLLGDAVEAITVEETSGEPPFEVDIPATDDARDNSWS